MVVAVEKEREMVDVEENGNSRDVNAFEEADVNENLSKGEIESEEAKVLREMEERRERDRKSEEAKKEEVAREKEKEVEREKERERMKQHELEREKAKQERELREKEREMREKEAEVARNRQREEKRKATEASLSLPQNLTWSLSPRDLVVPPSFLFSHDLLICSGRRNEQQGGLCARCQTLHTRKEEFSFIDSGLRSLLPPPSSAFLSFSERWRSWKIDMRNQKRH